MNIRIDSHKNKLEVENWPLENLVCDSHQRERENYFTDLK